MEKRYKAILNERIESYGIDSLHTEEILHILTGIGIDKISESIKSHSLVELVKYVNTITLTRTQKKKLSMLYELAKRLSVAQYGNKPCLSSSSLAGQFFVDDMKFNTVEVFKVAYLDAQNRLILLDTASEGVVNECPIYPRAIIKTALNCNALGAICAHVHPGGSLTFSRADIESTKKLKEAFDTVGLKFIDHVLVSEGQYTSMAEKGMI